MNLRNTGKSNRHNSCYLNLTGACSSTISSEHLVSEGVLRVLADQEIELSGLPWLKGGKKTLGFGAFTANCLCIAHNSALSRIDTAGAYFFDTIQKCGTSKTGPQHDFLMSGHDVERWLLRTLAAMAVSKNFAIDGACLDGEIVERLRISELLEDPAQWTRPLGLYLMKGAEHTFVRRENIELAPILKRGTDEIVGILIDIQGPQFGLLAADHDIQGTGLDKAVYRPGRFIFQIGHLTHTIQVSWNDAHPHMNMTLTWRE